MYLGPIVALLKANLSGYRVIGGAAELSAAAESTPSLPALYVVPGDEQGQDNEEVGGHAQPVDASFSIYLLLSSKRDATGAGAIDLIEPLTSAIEVLILGQIIGAVVQPIAFVSGKVVHIEPGHIVWESQYRTRYYKRKS